MSLTPVPLGAIHWTAGSPISESPSARVTVQVSEKGSPAIGISGGEILTVVGGSEGQKEWQGMPASLTHLSSSSIFLTVNFFQ